MSLQDLIASDAAALLSYGDFDESVLVTFADGTTRTIRAWVLRKPAASYGGGNRTALMEIVVANSAVSGISASESDPGGMTIALAQEIDGEPKAFSCILPSDGRPHQDVGTLRFELR